MNETILEENQLKAAICCNGHLIHSKLDYDNSLPFKYCKKCGEKIIDYCQNEECNEHIHGDIIVTYEYPTYDHMARRNMEQKDEFKYDEKYIIPNYCHGCGKPYQWTKKKLNDFKEILELQEEKLTLELQNKIFETVRSLSAETNQELSLGLQKLGLNYQVRTS